MVIYKKSSILELTADKLTAGRCSEGVAALRIIAGAFKGRILAPVQGRTRPTAAKVREAIFNILGAAVAEARVLDLFAGTGALGIEALSRGAAAAVFVEDQPEALKGLRRNLETLGLADRSQVLPLPVAAALRQLAARGAPFGLVFLDPPYGGGVAAATLSALAASACSCPRPGWWRSTAAGRPCRRRSGRWRNDLAALWRHPGGHL